jgi:site-specific DNA-methyltransferase (adenine-specific)
MSTYQIICGDCRGVLLNLENQVDFIITSPPYADARQKHYDSVKPENYANWFSSFHSIFWNTLKESGSLVINIKDKVVKGVRYRYVWETIQCLTDLGWHCIDDYIWVKKNPMPGFWPTRLRDGWEYCFHLAKSKSPFMNQAAVRIPIAASTQKRLKRLSVNDQIRLQSYTGSGFGRNLSRWISQETVLPSNVLTLSVETQNRQHPAVFPVALPSFFIKLLCPEEGLVVDPFAGSGTTGEAALRLGRQVILIDSNPNYCEIAQQRLQQLSLNV